MKGFAPKAYFTTSYGSTDGVITGFDTEPVRLYNYRIRQTAFNTTTTSSLDLIAVFNRRTYLNFIV